jgi:aminopeptidase-like protein
VTPQTTHLDAVRAGFDAARWGQRLHELVRELYPVCRSITGPGVRQTLEALAAWLPLEVTEVRSGTAVLDWTVPQEWRIDAGWIDGPDGRRVVDFADSNLHVVGYSAPVDAAMPLHELRPHLHSLPEQPHLIPYRTSYYAEDWGFCLPHAQMETLPEGTYQVRIDAELAPGSLTYGEAVIGDGPDEVLLSAHVCHPSLANDNLSGIAVLAGLGELLGTCRLRQRYRLLFIPGTIGAITWLARNEDRLGAITAGLVLAGVGDRGPLTYKRSRAGDARIDRIAARVLGERDERHALQDFSPWGYDERQFNSPGFQLPVGRLSRTPHGTYPEYHTSGDDCDFVEPGQLADTLETLLAMVAVLETDGRYRNLAPKGEPQLGRRGLYGSIGGLPGEDDLRLALLWVLNLSDGDHDLLAIAERSGLPFDAVVDAAKRLEQAGLLAPETAP